MTYEALEESHQSGEPVELYTFTRGSEIIARYTSGDVAVTVDSNTYSPWPGGMKRSEISLSGEDGRAALKITVARDHPIAQLIHLRPRTGVIGCTVHRYHRSDDTALIPIYAGRVLSARRARTGERTLIVEPRSISQNRIGLHRVCQPGCNHELYGPLCRLSMDDWDHATTIVSISGTALEVADVASGMPYTGGIVAYTDADGITDYAYIEEADGTTLTLDLAIYGAAATEAVTLYPGCDWTMSTCDTVFSNSENYGGRLHVPSLNPVTQDAFA